MFSMASRQDLDNWAELGNKGWGFDDMLPYYRKFETYNPAGNAFAEQVNDKYIDATLRGTSGPIQVSYSLASSTFFAELPRYLSQVMRLAGCRTCGPRRFSMQDTSHPKTRAVDLRLAGSTSSTQSIRCTKGEVMLPVNTTNPTPNGRTCLY